MTTPETPESEDANMNKCPMCGHVSEDGANFCSRCGTRLGVPIDTPGGQHWRDPDHYRTNGG